MNERMLLSAPADSALHRPPHSMYTFSSITCSTTRAIEVRVASLRSVLKALWESAQRLAVAQQLVTPNSTSSGRPYMHPANDAVISANIGDSRRRMRASHATLLWGGSYSSGNFTLLH